MREQVERILNERVRPQLAAHRGGVELLDVKDGVVRLRLSGQCSNCPVSCLTTEYLILAELSQAIPEVKDVVVVHSVSEDLLAQAREILGRRHGNK